MALYPIGHEASEASARRDRPVRVNVGDVLLQMLEHLDEVGVRRSSPVVLNLVRERLAVAG